MHRRCIDKQFLVRKEFRCKNVERYLGNTNNDGMITELQPRTTIPPKPTREDMKCIICGDECTTAHPNRIPCTEMGCKYGAHEDCAAILEQVNDDYLDTSTFKCNHVNYYLKSTEVSNLSLSPDPATWKAMKIKLKSRGVVKPECYTPKRKRYENPDIQCDKCGEIVNINEPNHELAYCNARYAGTPIPTRDYEYVLSRAKRIRRMTLKDFIP